MESERRSIKSLIGYFESISRNSSRLSGTTDGREVNNCCEIGSDVRVPERLIEDAKSTSPPWYGDKKLTDIIKTVSNRSSEECQGSSNESSSFKGKIEVNKDGSVASVIDSYNSGRPLLNSKFISHEGQDSQPIQDKGKGDDGEIKAACSGRASLARAFFEKRINDLKNVASTPSVSNKSGVHYYKKFQRFPSKDDNEPTRRQKILQKRRDAGRTKTMVAGHLAALLTGHKLDNGLIRPSQLNTKGEYNEAGIYSRYADCFDEFW